MIKVDCYDYKVFYVNPMITTKTIYKDVNYNINNVKYVERSGKNVEFFMWLKLSCYKIKVDYYYYKVFHINPVITTKTVPVKNAEKKMRKELEMSFVIIKTQPNIKEDSKREKKQNKRLAVIIEKK